MGKLIRFPVERARRPDHFADIRIGGFEESTSFRERLAELNQERWQDVAMRVLAKDVQPQTEWRNNAPWEASPLFDDLWPDDAA